MEACLIDSRSGLFDSSVQRDHRELRSPVVSPRRHGRGPPITSVLPDPTERLCQSGDPFRSPSVDPARSPSHRKLVRRGDCRVLNGSSAFGYSLTQCPRKPLTLTHSCTPRCRGSAASSVPGRSRWCMRWPMPSPRTSICWSRPAPAPASRWPISVSYTHLRAHETDSYLVCRLLLEKKKENHCGH